MESKKFWKLVAPSNVAESAATVGRSVDRDDDDVEDGCEHAGEDSGGRVSREEEILDGPRPWGQTI